MALNSRKGASSVLGPGPWYLVPTWSNRLSRNNLKTVGWVCYPHCYLNFLQCKDLSVSKEDCRRIGLSIRKKAFEKDQLFSSCEISEAGLGLKNNLIHLFDFMNITNELVISSYMAVRSEINTYASMKWLNNNGYNVCLPVIEKENNPLEFYEWSESTQLKLGLYGIPVPYLTKKVEPDVLLCPLVSFDIHGNRLGYGGGYYDRTIQKLQIKKDILAIGLGFSEQKSRIKLPFDNNDQILDAMVTDKGFFMFN